MYETSNSHPRVPIWIPDSADPEGLEGRWQFVDPDTPPGDPRLAAQTFAVAELWEAELHWGFEAPYPLGRSVA